MARCDSYYFGQCTYGACIDAGWIPDDLGNGGDWARNAPALGLQVTDIPTISAAVSYCPGDGYSEFGHCGIVTQVYPDGSFQVYEMNYVGFDVYDSRHSSAFDVCGFILPPGVQPGKGPGQGGGSQGGGSSSGIPGPFNDVWTGLAWWVNTGDVEGFNAIWTARAAIQAAPY